MDKGLIIGILVGLVMGLVLGWLVFSNDISKEKINLQTEDDVKEFVVNYAYNNSDKGLWEPCRNKENIVILEKYHPLIGVNCYSNSGNTGGTFLILDKEGNIINGPSEIPYGMVE